MADSDDARPQAEQQARVLIDRQLVAAGCLVQDRAATNLSGGPGVAVREAVMAAGHGRADYLLYVDTRARGVIEAKPEGITLSRLSGSGPPTSPACPLGRGSNPGETR